MSRIIPRNEWGAQYRDGVANRSVGRLDKIAHHSVTTQLGASATFAQDAAEVRKIERIGQQRFGAGMSYTFLVFPSGRVFQGVSISRHSYHTGGGHNSTGVGTCFPGNYENHKPTQAQLDAVAWLLQEGVRRGWWTVPAVEMYHKQVKATSCPGKHVIAQIPATNRKAAGGNVSVKPVAPKARPVHAHSISPSAYPQTTAGIDPSIPVEQVQRQLAGAGFYDRQIDGKAGPYTYAGIYAFQKNQRYFPGLLADAYWGKLTQKHYEWVKTQQKAINKWRAVIRLGGIREDGDFGAFNARCVDAIINANFNGAYTKAVKAVYGANARPVNDKTPGKAFCHMLGIPTHPMG